MGCSLSGSVDRRIQLNQFLTTKEVELVQQTWKIIGEDMTKAGLLVFKRLFEKQTSLKSLFCKMMTHTEDGTIDEMKLRRHATIVMEGLGAAIESLEDSFLLTNVLISMGKRHAGYNVKVEMVQHLWPAIRDSFCEILGEEFTIEMELAWLHVFEYIGTKFKQGIIVGKNEYS